MNNLNILPPQVLDMEEAILGVALFNNDNADYLINNVPDDAYYNPKNSTIAQAIRSLRFHSNPVDILTVKDELKRTGNLEKVGGAFRLTELTSRVNSDANFEYHCNIVLECHWARNLIQTYQKNIGTLYQEHDVPKAISNIDKIHFEILTNATKRKRNSMDEIAQMYLDKLELRMAQEGSIIGIPCGIHAIDLQTLGFQETEMTIIGARPSMGKTDWGLNFAYGAAKLGYKTAFFTLEMSETKLFNRLMAIETGYSKNAFSTGDKSILCDRDGLTRPEIFTAVDTIRRSGMVIMDLGVATVHDIKHHCSSLVKQGTELIVIDYLGLVKLDRGRGLSTNDALGEVSREIKMAIAKDLNCTVIALHQLSRSCENRGGDKRPILSDLRDSGNLEQDADRVGFIYRPEYYGFETTEDGRSTAGVCEMIFAKNRESEVGTVPTFYNPENGRISSEHFPATEAASLPF